MSAHTKGPWTVRRIYGARSVPDAVILQSTATDLPSNDPVILAVREDWLRVCEPNTDERSQRMSADLRLIAAAPELLEALRDLMNRHTYPDACECGACERAREVLRQATRRAAPAKGD